MLGQIEIGWWIGSLLLSLLFAGMELAYISSGKLQYAVGNALSNPYKFLLDTIYKRFARFQSTLMVGRILLLVVFVFITALMVYHLSSNYLHNDLLKIVIVILVDTLLLLLTMDFLPRVLFGRNPDRWVIWLLFPAFLIFILFYPIAALFVAVSKVIVRLCGVNLFVAEDNPVIYRNDFVSFKSTINGDAAKEIEVDSEVKIFKNALDFSSKKVRDCMVPRAEIVAVAINTDLDTLKELFIESGISRILVFKDTLDNIVGYIHMWEIFNNPKDWTNNLASISFVPESMQANRLMSDLMQDHKSIAVVVDEFGGTSGIVTMEDLVEEIFGDIEDEYDVESKFLKKEGENDFVMSGRVEIDHLNEEYHLEIPESDQYSTIAGYLLHHMQRFPKTYETVVIGKYTFKILKVTARKIEVVKLISQDDSTDEIAL